MKELKTFYIKQLREICLQWYKEIPTEFKAIKVKVDGEEVLHILDQHDTQDTFVRGKGRVRLGKRKVFTIPVWNGDADTIKEYVNKYGLSALFRSMTFADLLSNDCTVYAGQLEFGSFIRYGLCDIDRWNKFQTLYEKFLEMERQAVVNILKREDNDWSINFHLEHHSLRPTFSTMSIVMPPNVSILRAEEHLKSLAIEGLYNQNLTKEEFTNAREEIFKWFNNHNIPEMVERYYGKPASDLYNELHLIYSDDDINE